LPNNVLIFGLVLVGIVVVLCGFSGVLVWKSGVRDVVSCMGLNSSGRWHDAILPCREYVAKNPNSGEAHNELAWCLTVDHQVPEGLKEARKATALQPNSDNFDTLAMALALSGSGKEAMKVETDHVLVNGEAPDDPQRVTLGMVYYANGDKDKARVQWGDAARSDDRTVRDLALRFVTEHP
jgi:Flp pilus assembly protein TadD